MKTKALLLLLLGFLATTGSTCINDGFLISVNLPMTGCFDVNPGTNLTFNGSVTIKLSEQIDVSYIENIEKVRYYDIRVSTKGTYTGSVSGIALINNIQLLTYSGQWSDFATPQTLLQNSPRIQVQTAGLNELLRVLNLFTTDSNTTVVLSSIGSLSGQSPVPSGLSVCIEILSQVDTRAD